VTARRFAKISSCDPSIGRRADSEEQGPTMHAEASDKARVRTHVDRVRDALGDPRLQDAVERAAQQIPGSGDPLDKVANVIPADPAEPPSSGGAPADVPYFSRAPFVSLVQSHVDEALHEQGVADPAGLWSRIVHAVERALRIAPGSFTSADPDWYVGIARGVLEHLARGNHSFNPRPAEYEIDDDARLVVVGDWGTGLPRARDVATHMQEEIRTALADRRQVHVLHLGDVYYSGLDSEDRRRFLDFWPVTGDQAGAGVTSWSLNGNHDMYSGGFGYFATLLGDPRFSAQRSSDGAATSFFRLRSPSWDFVGLDTAWDSNVVSNGQVGVLEDPQAGYVARVAAESTRKLVLFSHHQLVSVYEKSDLGDTLPAKLGPVLTGNRVTAWWWGHEHRAIAYQESAGVRYPRCLGNGGVPLLPDSAPPAGSSPGISWHSTRTVRSRGKEWSRFGFAVLDLRGDRISVRYRDDDGTLTHTEWVS
jgi:hypothetical protein